MFEVYMLVGGCPIPCATHAERVCDIALAMMKEWELLRVELTAQFGLQGTICIPVLSPIVAVPHSYPNILCVSCFCCCDFRFCVCTGACVCVCGHVCARMCYVCVCVWGGCVGSSHCVSRGEMRRRV